MGNTPVAVFDKDATNAIKPYFIYTDGLGTPRTIVDANQNWVWYWDFADVWGEKQPQVQTLEFNLRFPGQYYDGETGLHYNWHRDYNPLTGRYSQADPLGLSAGWNLYAYAGNNPAMFADPMGLFLTSVDAACMQDPAFCAEVSGQIVQNAGAITRDPCISAAADKAANNLRNIGNTLTAFNIARALSSLTIGGGKALGEGGAVNNLLYGGRVGEGLPGTAGVAIAGRPTAAQLELLTAKHGVEFAVTYKLGPGKGGSGGQYHLHSGNGSSVSFPLEADRMLITHTHPGGTAYASSADFKVLEQLKARGSPQRSSQIIPVGKDPIRFGIN